MTSISELTSKIFKAEEELKELIFEQERKKNISEKQGTKAFTNVDRAATKAFTKADKEATRDFTKADRAATKAFTNVDRAATKAFTKANKKASGGAVNKNYAYGGRVAKMSAEKS